MTDYPEYRIDFTITRRLPGEDEFSEIGFGSSGASGSPDHAAYELESIVQNGQWETSPGMPDPHSVRRECAMEGGDD